LIMARVGNVIKVLILDTCGRVWVLRATRNISIRYTGLEYPAGDALWLRATGVYWVAQVVSVSLLCGCGCVRTMQKLVTARDSMLQRSMSGKETRLPFTTRSPI
jgi:hypothetical protein